MKKILSVLLIGILIIGLFSIAMASSDTDEAKALVNKAKAYLKTNGKDKTIAAANDKNGPFVKGTLYVFIYDDKGSILAHPMNPGLVGKYMLDIKDSDGRLFSRDFYTKAKAGGGWVDYRWTNPVTKVIEPKSSYVIWQDNMIIGCGIYKK